MILRNINRITSYIMNSDFKTDIQVTVEGRTFYAHPAILARRAGVLEGNMFYPAKVISELVTPA